MYTPVNPSFTIQKWGLSGSKVYRRCFVMERDILAISIYYSSSDAILWDQKCMKMHEWLISDRKSHNIRKWPFGHVRQRRFRSACAFAQSNKTLHCTVKDAKCLHADNEDWLNSEDAQADFSLCWAHMSQVTGLFSGCGSSYATILIDWLQTPKFPEGNCPSSPSSPPFAN